MTISYYEDAQAYCTEQWHRVSPFLIVTDGVLNALKKHSCFWVADVIGSYGKELEKLNQDFVVALVHVENEKADVILEDGNDNVIFRQSIPFTDLTVNLRFYVQLNQVGEKLEWIACLPSEY